MEPVQHKTAGSMVGERRGHARFHLLIHLDIAMTGSGETYWGSLRDLSRTGVALCARQFLKPGQPITIRFRFHGEERREVAESLAAKVIWRNGDNTGLEFETPLTTASPALQKAPYLAAHLIMKEVGR